MSDLAAQSGLGLPHALQGKWGWFVFLGLLMIAAGCFALVDTVLVTLFSVIFIGATMVVGGAVQLIHAFANRGWGNFLFGLALGILYIVAGFLIMEEPVRGSLLITLFLIAVLAVGGVVRVIVALRHTELNGWWVVLLGGLVSIGLAALLYLSFPWSGLWVLGMLIAIELLIQGFTWVIFGFALRALR